ncbi:sulfatase-like hydrolase/transferase [Psychroserpens jangbogonensis]|uniref:sulfatase-like hydrolase/transferase n=1 Tax=Psychroserpens jangbogonensis TaxID=1484460 RepID=UPI00053EE0FD|nr:sulfatase-like hydrolase/transferase [Psychroserpens jangbogonensis]
MIKRFKPTSYLLLICLIVFFGCNKTETTNLDDETITPSSPNILFILADDMGKDATNGFSEGNLKPNMPNIDNFTNSGITFSNCWVYSTCSPTRASILTGKYGYRTGVKWANDELNNSETILQKYIKQQTNDSYSTAVIGKWHLSGNGLNQMNPETFGMDYYAGLVGGGVQSYYQWPLLNNDQQTTETDYITEKFTDLSIDWIDSQDKPWFLWLAYTAPHTPFHAPPAEMHSQGNLPDYVDGMEPLPYYLAAIEAMDFQIGRLLDNIPENERNNTIIIFVGDNGTPNQVAQLPYSSTTAKGSLYQGGINTPLIVSGANVGRFGVTDDNLITSTDLFATIAELSGITVPSINDSKSFKSLLSATNTHRNFQYSEKDDGTTESWVLSNGQFKLFTDSNGNQEMYDLDIDPYESNNLLDGVLNSSQQESKEALESELIQIRN